MMCVERVWLLGSRVRGEARPDSDLDIAIETAGCDPAEALANYMLDVSEHPGWLELERRFRVKMGITPADDVRAGIADHGELIFSRDGWPQRIVDNLNRHTGSI